MLAKEDSGNREGKEVGFGLKSTMLPDGKD
jgi:hypothetical protein